jgi:hypothetical protein
MRRAAALSLIACAVASCSLLDFGGLERVHDGGGADAGDAGTNLATNGGFEDGAGGCGVNWTGDAITRSTTARTGSASCEVCGPTQSGYSITQVASIAAVVPGASYYAEAWIHAPVDDAGAADPSVQLFLTMNDGAGTYIAGSTSAVLPASGTWTMLNATHVAEGNAATATVTVNGSAMKDCFLIDDVLVVRQ